MLKRSLTDTIISPRFKFDGAVSSNIHEDQVMLEQKQLM